MCARGSCARVAGKVDALRESLTFDVTRGFAAVRASFAI